MLRSLEHVLQKIIRMLVGRLSLVRLTELIRTIYIQESESRLKNEFPDKKVSLSQLALMTGIDTRTLKGLMSSEAYEKPVHENNTFLQEMTPETRILSVWMSDPRFFDYDAGQPMALDLKPGKRSITELVSRAIGTRGLTIQSVIKSLEAAGSIEVDQDTQLVRFLSDTYYPFLSHDEAGMLDVGFSTAASLLGTVNTNLDHANQCREKFFQRSAFTHQLSPKRQVEFRRVLHDFLEQSDKQCKSVMAEIEDNMPLPGQITAGVSMFYFEETGDGACSKASKVLAV